MTAPSDEIAWGRREVFRAYDKHAEPIGDVVAVEAFDALAARVEAALWVLTEYEAAGTDPAPFTSERALYERMSSALHDPRLRPGKEAGQ